MHSDQDPNSSDYEDVKDSDLPNDDDVGRPFTTNNDVLLPGN